MSERGRRGIRIGLWFWCLFTIYGSFVPFRFTTDPASVRRNLARAQIYLFRDGRRNFSIPDVTANVLLFVPFGFLAALSGGPLGPARRGLRIAIIGLSAAVFATAIEGGQLFTTERTSSVLDAAANTTGAVLGAAVAWTLSRIFRWQLSDLIVERVRAEPVLLLLGLLGLALAADAFYPFAITLDVSTVWDNLKNARWLPFAYPARRFWPDLLMDQVLMFGFFAAALLWSLQSLRRSARAAGTAWVVTVLFSVGLEIAKLGFAGRYPNADNVVLAAAGALAGVTLVPMIVSLPPVRSHSSTALLFLALVLLTYAALTPFEFRLTQSAIAHKVADIEWLPLTAYYHADSQRALFDLWQKLLRYGFLGFSVAGLGLRKRWMPVAVGLAAGALLETAQLLTVARVTSVTDVLIAGTGALLGGAICMRYRTWRNLA